MLELDAVGAIYRKYALNSTLVVLVKLSTTWIHNHKILTREYDRMTVDDNKMIGYILTRKACLILVSVTQQCLIANKKRKTNKCILNTRIILLEKQWWQRDSSSRWLFYFFNWNLKNSFTYPKLNARIDSGEGIAK